MSNYFLNIRLGDSKKDDSLIVGQSLTETTANIVGTSCKGAAFVPQKIFAQNQQNNVEVYNTLQKTLGSVRENTFGHLYDEYACYQDNLAYLAADFWISNGGQHCSFTRVLGIGNGTINPFTGKMYESGFNASNNISKGTITQTLSRNISSVDSNISGSVSFIAKTFNEISKRPSTFVLDDEINLDTIDYLNELGFYRDDQDNALNLSLENKKFISDVVITPQGVLPSLLLDIDENQIYTYKDEAASYANQIKVVENTNQFFVELKGFKPYLEEYNTNLNKASSYYHDDFGRNLNFIDKQEIYSNPDKNYFFNRFIDRGHLVYASFPFGGLNDSRELASCQILTTKPYDDFDEPNFPDYNSFESEYTTAKTPWVTSQPLNRKDLINNREKIHEKTHDLFRFWSLDDGEIGNRFRIKINLIKKGTDNIETNFKEKDTFASFDIYIYEYDPRSNEYSQLESFVDVDLNPESQNYIGRLIGTKHTYYDINLNKVIEKGSFSNKSNFLRVEISEDIEDKKYKFQHQIIPSGFRSYPVLKLDHQAFDNITDNLSIYQLPPMYKLNNYQEYTDSNSQLTDHLNEISWGVLFNNAKVKNNKTVSLSTDVMSDKVSPHFYYTKYFLNATNNSNKDIWIEQDNYLNSFFHLEKIVYRKTKGLKDSRYKHSGRTTSDENWEYLDLSNEYIWNSDRYLKYSLFKDYLSFDFFTYGGFDGLDIRDSDKKNMKNEAILREEYDSNSSKTTLFAYQKAIDIATDYSNCAGDLLLTPGISSISIIRKCIDKCESDRRHFYVADIKSSYVDKIDHIDTNNNNKIVKSTLGTACDYYYIENSLSDYVLNQISITNMSDIHEIVNYTKIIKEKTQDVISSWTKYGIESRYILPTFGDILAISYSELENNTFDKFISPEVFVLAKIASTIPLPRVSLTQNIFAIQSFQTLGDITFKLIDNENLYESGINFDNIEKLARESKLNLIYKPRNITDINLLSDNTSYINRKSIFQKQNIVRTLQEIKKKVKYDLFLNEKIIPGSFWFTQNSNLNNLYDKLKIQLDTLMQQFLEDGYITDYKVKIPKADLKETVLDMQRYIIRGNIIIQFEESDIISLRLDEILSDLSINAGDTQDSVFIPII